MLTRSSKRLDGAFEFSDGFRRFAVIRGGLPGLEPGRAVSLLRARLFQDWYLRRSLAGWYRRTTFAAGLADDEQLLARVLRDVSSSFIRVHELERLPVPTYAHTYHRSEAPIPEPEPPAPNEFDPGLDEPTATQLRTVEYLALGDFNFSTDRAVMLPGPSSDAEAEGDLADGVALIAGLLAHLRRVDAERRIMATGHTDAAGSFAHNLELSEVRATSVKLACEGDADRFADHAVTHGEVADGQEVLRWIALRFGWECDPGAVDNEEGPKTAGARNRFRDRFFAEFHEPAGSGPKFARADWLAFFRLYEQDLAARLGVTPGGLPELRKRLVWAQPATLGCGEHWPEDKINRSPVNSADRRVELLCFRPDHVPAGAGQPPGATVYDDPTYRWTAIRPGPGPHPLGGPCFELSLFAENLEWVGNGAALRLRGGPYDLRHQISDARRNDGFLTFHFHGVCVGHSYNLTLEPGDGSPSELMFEGASLDSYIEGIGVPKHRPDPIIVRVPRGPERWEDEQEEIR